MQYVNTAFSDVTRLLAKIYLFQSEALTLRTFKLPIGRPFKPAFLIFGQPSLGLTYDETLTRYTEYSQKLRNTIWSCLYEKPVHRLTLYELKCHVVRGKRMALAAAEQAIKEFPRNQAEAAGKLAKDRAEILASYQRDLAIFRRDRAVYGDAEPTLVVIPDPPVSSLHTSQITLFSV